MTVNFSKRHTARKKALQGLYQWQLTGHPAKAIVGELLSENVHPAPDVDYLNILMTGVINHKDDIDELFKPYLDRDIGEIMPTELAIIRIGVYELKYQPTIPYKVVINEAIRLAKTFGATDAHKYVNGILDKVRLELCD